MRNMTKRVTKRTISTPLLVLAVLLLGWIIYKGYDYYTVGNIHHKFTNVEEDMDKAVASFKQDYPTSTEQKTKYCRQDQEIYGGGQLGCYIDAELAVSANPEAYKKIVDDFSGALTGNNFLEESKLAFEGDHDTGQFKNITTNLNCYPSYEKQTNGLKLHFYCADEVRKAIFVSR